MGDSSSSSTRTIRALVVLWLVWTLLVGSPDSSFSGGSAGKFAGAEMVEHGPTLDRVAYMSKRRVPNGPDPIHNRRAGKSGKPSGQA